MATLEQQVLANTLMLQEILEDSQNAIQFDEIPGGILPTDIIMIARPDGAGGIEDTYNIPYNDLLALAGQQSWNVKSFGIVPTAGDTTTNIEIQDRINDIGFEIESNQIMILRCIIKQAGNHYVASYFFRPNEVGVYGNAGTAFAISQVYEFELGAIGVENAELVVIDLGDIGTDEIWEYFNTTPQIPNWDLQANNIYAFKCVQNSVRNAYLYVGQLPRHLGQEDPNVATASDFELIKNDYFYSIDGCLVLKQGNLNHTELEVNDIVFFKEVQYNGRRAIMIGWQYNGGATNDINNYEKVYSII